MNKSQFKAREWQTCASAAHSWQRDALLRPVIVLVSQLDQTARDAFVIEVVNTANSLQDGDTLIMKGNTWIASAIR